MFKQRKQFAVDPSDGQTSLTSQPSRHLPVTCNSNQLNDDNHRMASKQAAGGARRGRGLKDITNVNVDGNEKIKVDKKPLVKKNSDHVGTKTEPEISAAAHPVMNDEIRPTSSVPTLPFKYRPGASPTKRRTATGKSSSSSSHYRREADDIDARDVNNPLMVTEYVTEIYQHLRSKELQMSVNPTYMERQPHINEKMRAILIDWLIEVHQKFRCVPETLFLTVNLIDRFLELETVERSKLQLLGVTALLVASKYEEIYPPELRDLVYITDKAYSQQEILTMEETVLKALEFKVTIASTHCFLVRYLKAAHADRKLVWLACFILERTLQEYHMLKYLPSTVASSAIYLARKNLHRSPWSPTLVKYTQNTESSLRACLQEISQILSSKSNLTAVKKKYSSQKFGVVANMALEGV